jgi:dihydropteroate synthase
MKKMKFHTLGVLNRTPNSFSDAGNFLDKEKLFSLLFSHLNSDKTILDIGFESTAPMNQAISNEEEWNRFKEWFTLFKEFIALNPDLLPAMISIDTYKIQNFKRIYREFKSVYSKMEIIFNDVSGVLDHELLEFLPLMKKGESYDDAFYIFCSTKIPDRKNVHEHMKTLNEADDIVSDTLAQFKKVIDLFTNESILDKLILDPGFGFSKTYRDNWKLIKNFEELLDNLPNTPMMIPILIGVSKKSFMQKKLLEMMKLEKMDNCKNESEIIHFQLIIYFNNMSYPFYYRVHSPSIVELALKTNLADFSNLF